MSNQNAQPQTISLAQYREGAAIGKRVFVKTYLGNLEVTSLSPSAGWIVTGRGLDQRHWMVGENCQNLMVTD